MGKDAVMNKEMKPKISIMIPTYNQDSFIRDAIESALAQTYPNLEVVVGDDASTDLTHEIISKLDDPRLKYIRNKNNLGRVSNYRNLLCNHVSGDYVVNLDGDDYYTDPEFLSEAFRLIECNQNVVMVVARATTKSPGSESISELPDYPIANGMELLRRLPDAKYHLMHMAVIYARRPALELGFYRSSATSSDWESLHRLSLLGNVVFLNRNVGVWRIHGKNETQKMDSAKALDNLAIWPAIYREAQSFGMNLFLAKYLSARCTAFCAQSHFEAVSLCGNVELIKFGLKFVMGHGFAAILFFLKPINVARIIFGIFGYYRNKYAI